MKKRGFEISTSSSIQSTMFRRLSLGQRKGATHVDFVLSFVIFIVFLVFLYTGLDPIIKTSGSKQFVLGHLKLALIENLTLSDFTIQTFTLDLTNTDVENKMCIKLTGQDGGALWDITEDGTKDLIIKRISGEIINYSFNSGKTIMGIGPFESNEGNILKIYFASGFVNRSPELSGFIPASCTPVNKDDYEIKAIEEREIISDSNIFDICDIYEDQFNGYDNLKDSLGVPAGSEFSFVFRDTSGTEICPKPESIREPPSGVNVYVGEFPVQYVDGEATILIGFITVKVW